MEVTSGVSTRHLFLNGGSPPLLEDAAKCLANIIPPKSTIAIICVERTGWQQYMPKYEKTLKKYHDYDFQYIPLPTSPVDIVQSILRTCAGIIIGGGDTKAYVDFIVHTPIGAEIRMQYAKGIPVIGFSAGALICLGDCVISAKDNREKKIMYRQGLSLLDDIVVSVHFSQWNEAEHLREAVNNISPQRNYGIDETACIYFKNENLEQIIGGNIFTIEDGLLRKV